MSGFRPSLGLPPADLVRSEQGPVYGYFFAWGVLFGTIGGGAIGLMIGLLIGRMT